MHNYLLAEFVTRMRVSSKKHFKSFKMIKSKFILELVNILYKAGFIRGFFILKEENNLLIYLKYNNKRASFYSVELISKPGKRVYWGLNYMSLCYSAKGFGGMYVVSTPKGLLTSTECLLSSHISGEILLKLKV